MRRWGPEDYRDMPWKNGGGVTRELLKVPHPREPARFLLRLSIATVAAPGPFSAFVGVDRTLQVLEGEGMSLTREGAPEVVLRPTDGPFRFAGEEPIEGGLLGGPVRDFNVMVDRALAEASLEGVRLAAGEERGLTGAGRWWVYGQHGRVQVDGEPVAEGELLELDGAGPPRVRALTGAWVLAICLRPKG